MAVRLKPRLDPIERDIRLIIDQEMGEEAQNTVFREAAGAALAEAQAINERALGYVPEHDLYVDGAKVESLASARARSVMIAEFHLLEDVIRWIDDRLILHSPVGNTPKSPEYSKSHTWFADNIEFDVDAIPPAEQYIVLSTVPYARKIERGLSPQAPDGVYQAVSAEAVRRFGNIAYVGFTYRSIPGGSVGEWAQSATARFLAKSVRGGNPRTHTDWLTRQPAIAIDPGRR